MIKNLLNILFYKNNKQQKPVLSEVENRIYNDGERLIPGITHNEAEAVRHSSSYAFFKAIIASDLSFSDNNREVSVIDMGCGVGHGCKALSSNKRLAITGIDSSADCINYARKHYNAANIEYKVVDIVKFIQSMPKYDYVISRGVFEHIPDGLYMASEAKWHNRLIFDVPYNEQAGNPYHTLLGITEKDFEIFNDHEIFYQDLSGTIYDSKTKPSNPNMIVCVCGGTAISKNFCSAIEFPIQACPSN